MPPTTLDVDASPSLQDGETLPVDHAVPTNEAKAPEISDDGPRADTKDATVEVPADGTFTLQFTRLTDELERRGKTFEDLAALLRAQNEELSAYKQGLLDKMSHVLVTSIIEAYTDLGRTVRALREDTEKLTVDRLLSVLDQFSGELEFVLEKADLIRFENEGAQFDRKLQHAIKTVPTDDPGLVGMIHQRLRPGFRRNDLIYERERVSVYVAEVTPSPTREP